MADTFQFSLFLAITSSLKFVSFPVKFSLGFLFLFYFSSDSNFLNIQDGHGNFNNEYGQYYHSDWFRSFSHDQHGNEYGRRLKLQNFRTQSLRSLFHTMLNLGLRCSGTGTQLILVRRSFLLKILDCGFS